LLASSLSPSIATPVFEALGVTRMFEQPFAILKHPIINKERMIDIASFNFLARDEL
jgi:hypothetical protein